MTIYLSQEVLIPLIIGTVALFIVLIFSLRSSIKANGEMATTLIAMNGELQEAVKDRRASEAERQELREQVSTLATEKNLLTAEVRQLRQDHNNLQTNYNKLRTDSEEANRTLGLELVRVKGELKAAKDQIVNLERSGERKDAEITTLSTKAGELQTRVEQLEADLAARDGKIDELETALHQSEKERVEQGHEMNALRAQMNGKADKQPAQESEPEVSESLPEHESEGKEQT